MLGIPFIDQAIRSVKTSLFDDPIDRLNYYVTTILLIFFAIMVSAKQYVGKPIQCWVEAQFRGGWEQYIEDYCFIQNTYFIPFDDEIPRDDLSRSEKAIGYYQWVPIVLAIQAFMFSFPNIVWKTLNWQSGVNVKAIVRMARASSTKEHGERLSDLCKVAKYCEECIGIRKDLSSQHAKACKGFMCFSCGRHNSSFVTWAYLFVKVLYVANVIGQFFLLNAFLGTDYTFWGVQIMRDLVRGIEWQDSGNFPRVTLCDFQVRKMANIHRHTTQCVLMINLFNEKIYLFLWFWFFFVAVCTALNLFYWLYISFAPQKREDFVHKYLRVSSGVDDTLGDRYAVRRFTLSTLKPDGVLILRFIAGHAGDMVALDLAGQLWKSYLERAATLQIGSRRGNESPDKATDPGSLPDKDPGVIETIYGVDSPGGGNGGGPPGQNGTARAPLLPSAPGGKAGYPGPPMA